MTALPEHQRHAKHTEPHPDCAVCQAKRRMEGVPLESADHYSVRAVGGYMQESARFVR